MKFRKKPVVIEAWLNTDDGEPVPAWVDAASTRHPGGQFRVRTLEGFMVAMPGDWLIHGVKGEVYPCKPDIFEATYEPVEEAPVTTITAEERAEATVFECGPGTRRCKCDCANRRTACEHDFRGSAPIIDGEGRECGATRVCSRCGLSAYDHALWSAE